MVIIALKLSQTQRMRRAEGDLRAAQAVRIAGSVPALMMAAYERVDLGEEGDAGQHLGPDDRVPAHDRPLGLTQRARLAEDLTRNRDLADVVGLGGVANRLAVDRLEPELLGDLYGEGGHGLLVLGGV